MLLIYCEKTSYRLQYICGFIFKEQLGITYTLTLDADGFAAHEGPKINYSHATFDNAFNIKSHGLLTQEGIVPQDIHCFESKGKKAFFQTSGDIAFDVLAASFFLLSRYEEYLPHEKDMYGRYAHQHSIAYAQGFLQVPLINYWLKDLAAALKEKFPSLQFDFPVFSYIPTYDIDIAYAYRDKGLIRNMGGLIKSPSVERINVLLRLKKDPYDAYGWLDDLHVRYRLQPVYFFLAAISRGQYDKNLSPYGYAMWQLMKSHAKRYTVGIHPSWKSFEAPRLIKKEMRIVEAAGNITINESRQHYIKLSLPDTYHALINAGIVHDHSMGYGSINGFRASVASSFLWYDLAQEKITGLRLHPFCFMDANSHFEQQLSAGEAAAELAYYLSECKNVQGEMITIFHNSFLGTAKEFKGWRELYERFVQQVRQVSDAVIKA